MLLEGFSWKALCCCRCCCPLSLSAQRPARPHSFDLALIDVDIGIDVEDGAHDVRTVHSDGAHDDGATMGIRRGIT